MRHSRLPAVLVGNRVILSASLLLAVVLAAAGPAAAVAAPRSPAGLRESPSATPGAHVPCPTAAVPAPPPHPPRPSPPLRDRQRPVIGGEALGTPGLAVPDGVPAPPGNLSAASWLVADLDSGAVLGTCGPHELSPPASVQKLLLAATALPLLDPDQTVEIVPADLDIDRGSSAVGLVVGGHYPVSTLWLGLLLQSGNDAANTLARVAGGNGGVPATVGAMNETARRLGALDTHAATPSGLDGPGQFTSVYDLALIARACFDREDFRAYDTALTAQMPAQPPAFHAFQIQNENKLLTRYSGALGGKTGFTELARHTYVGAAQRDGRRLVVAILYAEAQPLPAWRQGAELLDWGFTVRPGEQVGHLVSEAEAARGFVEPSPAVSGARDAGVVRVLRDSGLNRWRPGTVVGVGAVAALVFGFRVVAVRRRLRRRRTALHRYPSGRPPPAEAPWPPW